MRCLPPVYFGTIIANIHLHLRVIGQNGNRFNPVHGALDRGDFAVLTLLDLSAWMRSNRLQLNAAKNEVLWCASGHSQGQLTDAPFTVGSDTVKPVRCVRDLGIYLDSDVTVRTHVSKTVASCFASLRQITSIQRSVSRPVHAAGTGHVTNSVKARLRQCHTCGGPCICDRLQSILHAAARLVNGSHKYDHVSSLLRDLHWLRVLERIKYRLAVLVFRCRNHNAPEYLSRDLHWVADDDSWRRLRSATTHRLMVPRTRLRTIGDRAFGIAGARVLNDLPSSVVCAPSLAVFKKNLKTHLFQQS